jgi:Family of unknown function (DUF6011)
MATLEPALPLDEDYDQDGDVAGERGRLTTAEDVKRYVLAGRATVTLVSKKTGNRYTYRINQPKPESPHFVKVMYGPDNTADYVFLGTIFDKTTYRHSHRKSPVKENDLRVQAFCYMWENAQRNQLPAALEVYHEGRCGKCGHKLTVPSSIKNGIGPECAKMK